MSTRLFIEYFLETGYYTQPKALPIRNNPKKMIDMLSQSLLKDEYIKGFRTIYQQDEQTFSIYTCHLSTAPRTLDKVDRMVTTRKELLGSCFTYIKEASLSYNKANQKLENKSR